MCSEQVTAIPQNAVEISTYQRNLILQLQSDFPICEEPFEALADRLDSSSEEIKDAITALKKNGVLTRFGPLFDIEKLGGCFSLCALAVPSECFDSVAEIVNSYDEVAHNYARDHEWNMWFVLATKSPESLQSCFDNIVFRVNCPSMNLPKRREFFVGLHFDI